MNSQSQSLALSKSTGGIVASMWSEEQVKLIKEQIAPKATDEELQLFAMVAHKHNLDPFIKQIHCVHRWDSHANKDKMAIQISIDGFRAIAARTGEYAGSDDPVFDTEKDPKKATVTVYRFIQGIRCPFTATARWNEFYPGEKMGFMWRSKPCVMLGKCAEAQALRKAFPEDTSDLYIEEELQKEDSGKVTGSPVGLSYDEALQKIAACKTREDLDTLKLKLSTDIGSLQPIDQKAIMEEVTKKNDEFLGKKKKAKTPEVIEAEIVTETGGEPPLDYNKERQHLIKRIKDCKNVAELDGLKKEIANLANLFNLSSDKDELIMAGKIKKEELLKKSDVNNVDEVFATSAR